jgi:hypothetical protein
LVALDWTAKIFSYCERGTDPSFWAEPFNAVSNAAFLMAAALAATHLSRDKRGEYRHAEWALIGLTAIIGTGSFLFHTFATRWAAIADTVPIGLFMLAYLAYALRRFASAPWILIAALLGIFVLALYTMDRLPCTTGLLPLTAAAGRPCFNGTLGYLPALVAMAAMAVWLLITRHGAGPLLLTAAMTLSVSMTLRTLDIEVCAMTEVLGRARGTHALWHLLNAAMLYLLLRAAIRHGRSPTHTPISGGTDVEGDATEADCAGPSGSA